MSYSSVIGREAAFIMEEPGCRSGMSAAFGPDIGHDLGPFDPLFIVLFDSTQHGRCGEF